jgi:hypothetical protein
MVSSNIWARWTVQGISLVRGQQVKSKPWRQTRRAGLMSKTTHPVRTYLFTLQYMANSTEFPDSDAARATNLNGNILASMAWCNLQGASINHTTPDGRRRFGLVRCRIQMPCPFYQNSDPRWQELVDDYRVAQVMGLAISQGKPACTHGWFLGSHNTYSSISANGCIWSPREWPKQGGILKSV